MTHQLSIIFTLLLPILLTTFKVSNAQGGTINVCGRNYKDAEDSCGKNPSCANLECPNKYWEEGGVLMTCFAVPAEKCNFGPPDAMASAHMPSELDPNNTNYCGPIDGSWQLAVDYCSPLTACPSGSPEECGNGWTCYSGVVCDPSSKSKTETVLSEDATADVSTASPVSIDTASTTNQDETQVETEVHEAMSDDTNEGVTSSASTESFTASAETESSPAAAVESSTSAPEDTSPAVHVLTDDTSAVIVPIENDSKSYCGPAGAGGWTRAISTCSRSSLCGAGGSCPEGQMCYGGIICNNVVDVPSSSTSTSTTTSTIKATSTTTSTPEAEDSRTPSTVLGMSTHHYCGPDPANDHNAWATALEQCSPRTECASNHPCPDGQICFGGIDCLVNTETTTSTTEAAGTTSSSTTTMMIDEVTTDATQISTTTSVHEYDESTSNPTTTIVASIDDINDENSSSDVAIAINDPPPQSNEQTPNVPDAASYCGPNPSDNDDAWMEALQNCSPESVCGNGRSCPLGQFCFGNIDCSMKEIFEEVEFDGIAAADDPLETSTTTTSSSTTTTSTTTTTTEKEENANLEDNTFYCGPEEKDGTGWLKASELCMPCLNGDGCGVGMMCYSGITCTKSKSSAADDMLLEVEEQVHIGYCGQNFYEARDNCSSRSPCSLDKDCDDWNPQCFPVRCEDETTYKAQQQQPVVVADGSANTLEDDAGPIVIIPNGSFCGAWYEETESQCTSRPPCNSAEDCDHEHHVGCFAGIECTFVKNSTEYEEFGARLDALLFEEDYSADAVKDDASHSNLRPKPASTTFNARSSSSVVGPYFLNGVACIILTAVLALLT